MRGKEFSELAAFVAIAENGSFVKAASVLKVSTSTLSQTIQSLEARLGVRLLNRTTRSVAVTQAGEQLLSQARPALDALGAAVETINALRDKPTGTLRLSLSTIPACTIIAPILKQFLIAYPAITLDIAVDNTMADIVSGRFDAGIRAVRWIERDMTAIQITNDTRIVTVASPEYLADRTLPKIPRDLQDHNCIRLFWAGETYRWEFQNGRRKTEVAVHGNLVTNDLDLMVRATLDKIGICYIVEDYVRPFILDGRLVVILDDWAPRYAGYKLFYPGRRQIPATLRAFIEFLRTKTPVL
jgi:DNA-binding transcriptional LysR family regulator